MKNHAQVVIIGGGIVGCSIAYHLGKLGWTDVLVIEKGELTSGSTWHAAGLVGQLRSSRNITRMLQYSVDLYGRLEEETGQATGWAQVGGLRIASSEDRMIELRKAATTARSFGLSMELLGPDEVYDAFPVISRDGIVGGAILPTDGHVDPSSVTQALALGARNAGVVFQRNTRVTDIVVKRGKVEQIVTDAGTVTADVLVIAAGLWSRQVGAMAGVNIPLIPVQHQFLVSEPIEDLPRGLPTMRDPDNLVYYKEEVGRLVMGGYEPDPIPWSIRGVPKEFGQELLAPNFDHFQTLSELAIKRTPVLENVGVRQLINGPEAFTTDGTFIMGEAPEVKGVFVAAGFNAHGIAAGGGAGKMLAEWIVEGQPSLDLWEVDIRRFGGYHNSLAYVNDRTCELYGKHYTMHWPHEEHQSGRGIRRSPLYDVLKQKGAVFGSKYGWERPNWFAPEGVEAKDEHTFARPNWFEHVGREHKAVREGVALIDQTSFSKIEVLGPGATDFLERLAVNKVKRRVGSLIYTQLCNERGGIEADLTIARLGKQHYYLVTGTAFGRHDLGWLRHHAPDDGSVILRDVTSSRAVINVCGPKSRELLSRVSESDFSNAAFKFARCREVDIGYAPVLASRVTYVGELGWELHIPTEYACHVYERLWEAGQDLGVVNAGYRAIESLRLEKGYRYWSSDLTPDYNPYEAGLDFCVSFTKDFIGRPALEAVRDNGVTRTLCCFSLSGDVILYGGETIVYDGEVVGVLTSGGFGYTVGKNLAYGYLPADKVGTGRYQIEVLGVSWDATMLSDPPYDPQRERILA